MDLSTLGQSPCGQLVPLSGHDARYGDFEYFAYLPDPLPADVSLSSRTWTSVTEAATALGRLDTACGQLPDPQLLIRPALWREALDTSALEGTIGALRDLLEAQLPSAQFVSPETAEIRAYERVALMAFETIKARPISVGFLCELQGELLKEASEPPRDLGKLRQDSVWIGPKNRPIHESRFVPPPPDDRLGSALDSWQSWIETEHRHLPPILRASLAHYQFETIHPFGDGNGRIGRLVVVLQLLRSESIRYPAVTVSPWLLRRREEYQGHLLAVSKTGDWNPWVQFFCQAVQEQSESLVVGAASILDWLKSSRAMLHERHWTGAIHRLLDDLVEWPVTTIADTATRYQVTPVHAARMIQHLVEVDVLQEITGKSYGRVFGATGVMDIVEKI